MWSTDMQCFIVQGEKLTFSMTEDVYFLTGLSFLGSALHIDPLFPWDGQLVNLARTYYSGEDFMSGSMVRIGVMDSLVHICIATMIIRVYGSLDTQWISGGQLRIMQNTLGGENFSWGLMLHAKMMR
jgi:hypothetical protein